jgi:hypothetical protein
MEQEFSCAPLWLVHSTHQPQLGSPCTNIISHVLVASVNRGHRDQRIVRFGGRKYTFQCFLPPTLFFFELLDVCVKFVEVLSLRLKLLFELSKARNGWSVK